MERSSAHPATPGLLGEWFRGHWHALVALATVDAFARLLVPASLIALAAGRNDLAVIAAALMSAMAVARGVVSGKATEAELVNLHGGLLEAAAGLPLVRLGARPAEHAAGVLVDAAHDVAEVRASVLPRLVADVAGLLAVSILTWLWLGLGWLVIGAAVGALAAIALFLGQLAMRRPQRESWRLYAEVLRDTEVMLDAAAELRAHRRASAFAARADRSLRQMARARRTTAVGSALVGLLPFAVALLAITAPLRATFVELIDAVGLERQAEVGILGATGLILSFGLVRSIEALVRVQPQMATLARFIGEAAKAPTMLGEARGVGDATIVFDRVRIRYPGASVDTPAEMSFEWRPGRGLLLTGENGSGKSSLALTLLGLMEPTEGEVKIGDVAAHEVAWPSGMVVYLPQSPYLAEGGSVRWHLELYASADVTDFNCMRALEKVGLADALVRHGERRGLRPLDVVAGELSGGERRRLALARAFLRPTGAPPPALIVLDEPEAGLDATGRLHVRAAISKLSEETRLLLIVHDESIVPPGFATVACRRGLAKD